MKKATINLGISFLALVLVDIIIFVLIPFICNLFVGDKWQPGLFLQVGAAYTIKWILVYSAVRGVVTTLLLMKPLLSNLAYVFAIFIMILVGAEFNLTGISENYQMLLILFAFPLIPSIATTFITKFLLWIIKAVKETNQPYLTIEQPFPPNNPQQ